MAYWLVQNRQGDKYIGWNNEAPAKNDKYQAGWTLSFPGTAKLDSDVSMYGLFGLLYKDIRKELDKISIDNPDRPIEVEFTTKCRYYES